MLNCRYITPVMYTDSDGHSPEWWNNLGTGWKVAIGVGVIVAMGILTVITAGGFAAAGTALLSIVSSTLVPSALSAIFAGACVGSLALGTAGFLIGGLTGDDGWSWDGASNGLAIGAIAGAVIGAAWGGAHFALQQAGKMALRTSINSLVNNPFDEFVKIGPRPGGISVYIRSIAQTGEYGQIYVSKLANGLYQIANGHHRVAALIALGYKVIDVFLTK